MFCHFCGFKSRLPETCPSCGGEHLQKIGFGTQRLEREIEGFLQDKRILRMDADSTSRRHSHDDILSVFRRGEADVLLGTQMIAKGLDFPNVTLVGVLNADSSLNMPDFRAAERTYQLLAQVAGRAGRAELPGEVFVQSLDPSAPAIQAASKGDYGAFAMREMKDREAGFFPPFCHLALVSFSSEDANLVSGWADLYARSLAAYAQRLGNGKLLVSEAVPGALEKADSRYRWQIVMRAQSASALVSAWRWIVSARPVPKGVRAVFDMDAHNLM